jgi:hypothetical protein
MVASPDVRRCKQARYPFSMLTACAAQRCCAAMGTRRPCPQGVNERNRYRDSPLRGGALLIASQLKRASIAERAELSIDVAATKSSSTLEHELRCFGRSRRSLASTLCELMRNAVLEEARVPGRTSRRCRPVHVSHACFAGFQHPSRSGSQLPVETSVLPFCSTRWSHK